MTEDKPHAAPLGGRPSIFTQAVADEICLRLMDGETLAGICKDDHMPARSTVHAWILENGPFRTQYSQARDCQADTFADEIIEIADNTEIGEKVTTEVEGGVTTTKTLTADMVEHRRLRMDARKWHTARIAPKKYGDRVQQEHSGPDGGPIQVNDVSLTDSERADRVAALLDAARARRTGSSSDPAQDVGAPTGATDGSVREPG